MFLRTSTSTTSAAIMAIACSGTVAFAANAGAADAASHLLTTDSAITLQPAEGAEAIADDAQSTSFLKGWSGSVQVGFSGTSGNSDNNTFRTQVSGTRATEAIDTSIVLVYRYSQQDSDDTENRFRADLRNDWKFGEDSRWVFFTKGTAEWDEFQDWDWRFSGALGLGYYFIKNDKTSLLGRVGVGGSYETGGMDDGFVPEGLLGVDFLHKLTDKQTITVTSEYLPSFDDLTEFRWNTSARYNIKLDDENGLYLSIGVDHRYDSDAGDDFDESDFDYFATLGWDF